MRGRHPLYPRCKQPSRASEIGDSGWIEVTHPPALGASFLEAFVADLHLSAQALNIKKRLLHRHIRLTFCGDNVFIKLPRRSFWARQRESTWGAPCSPSCSHSTCIQAAGGRRASSLASGHRRSSTSARPSSRTPKSRRFPKTRRAASPRVLSTSFARQEVGVHFPSLAFVALGYR